MSFLSPIFLLGLPLLAIPVGIHLLNRRQQKVLNWGAMRFLMKASTRRRRLWRFSDLLLLLLRVLAFLFIIGALARPLLPVTWLGHSGPRAVVLIIDPSLSLSARAEGTRLFNQLLARADKILDDLGPSDSLQILLARDVPVWLQETPVEGNPTEIQRLRTALHRLEPSLGSSDLLGAINRVLESPEDPEKMIRLVTVLTDGQAYGWSTDDTSSWSEIERKITALRQPTVVNLDLIDHNFAESANLSLDALRSPRTVTAVGQPVSLQALVQNRGSRASEATLLHWYAEDQSLGIASIAALPPGGSAEVELTHLFDSAGQFDIWCSIASDDPIELDNEAHLVFTVTDELPVLVADGSSATDPMQTDVGYLLASLGFKQDNVTQNVEWESGFRVEVIPVADLANQALDQFRCLILANPRRLAQAELEPIKEYVRNGGGLWLALGDAISAEDFNDTWFQNGISLSPLPLLTTIGDQDDRDTFSHIQPPEESHPATQLLADMQRLDIDRVQVFRRHQFDELRAMDTSILLRLDQGDALAVEKAFGDGRCIVLATPLGLAWSNFPVCQAYLAMVHEWIWYLAAPSFPRQNLSLGEPISWVLDSQNENTQIAIELPNNQSIPLSSEGGANAQLVRFSQTHTPGRYTLADSATGQRTPFVVERDPHESSLTGLTSSEREQLARIPGVHLGASALSIPRDVNLEIPTTPIAGTLLVILLALIAGELLLAAWCTHQRNPNLPSVSMEG